MFEPRADQVHRDGQRSLGPTRTPIRPRLTPSTCRPARKSWSKRSAKRSISDGGLPRDRRPDHRSTSTTSRAPLEGQGVQADYPAPQERPAREVSWLLHDRQRHHIVSARWRRSRLRVPVRSANRRLTLRTSARQAPRVAPMTPVHESSDGWSLPMPPKGVRRAAMVVIPTADRGRGVWGYHPWASSPTAHAVRQLSRLYGVKEVPDAGNKQATRCRTTSMGCRIWPSQGTSIRRPHFRGSPANCATLASVAFRRVYRQPSRVGRRT